MLSGNFAEMTTSTTFRDLLHAANLRRLFALKNPTSSAGFEPANLGTKDQHATPRPPKPLCRYYYFILILLIFISSALHSSLSSHTTLDYMIIHSFSILSDDRFKASSKTMPPHIAIQSLLLQMRISSPVLKVIQ